MRAYQTLICKRRDAIDIENYCIARHSPITMPIAIIILSAAIVLISVASQANIATADDVKLFVNNSRVLDGGTATVSSGTVVNFEVLQTSNLPVRLDPTGQNDIVYNLSGNPSSFSTSYNSGTYNPTVKVGDATKKFQLTVDQQRVDWLELVPPVSWPIVTLVVFACLFPSLRGLLSRFKPTRIETAFFSVDASDIGSAMERELERTISLLDIHLPRDLSSRFLPSSLGSEIAYYVHLLEFLDKVGISQDEKTTDEYREKFVRLWNAVGTYYFEMDFEKSKFAYEKAIALDIKDPSAYANLGMLYLEKKDHHTARQHLLRALEVAKTRNTPCPTAHMGMVVISSGTQDSEMEELHCEQAKRFFEEAVANNRTDYWSWFGLGWCWSYRKSDYSKAIEFTEKSLEWKPDFFVARYNLACFYAVKREADGAIKNLKEMLSQSRQTLIDHGFENDQDLAKLESEPALTSFCKFVGLQVPGSKDITG